MTDIWTALAGAADDHELAVLEEIGERAGVIWRCQADVGNGRQCGWVGRADEPECGDGRHPRPSAVVEPEASADKIRDAVLKLWDDNDAWIAGADYARLAKVLGVPPERTLTYRRGGQSRPSRRSGPPRSIAIG